MRVLCFYPPGGFLCLLCRYAFAKVERHNLITIDIHALQCLTNSWLYIWASNSEITIDQANEISFTYTHTVHLYRAYSGGDFCRLDIVGCFSHHLAICGEVGLEIKACHSGNTLGQGISWNNVGLFVRQIGGLAGAQDYIAIVG